MSKKNSRDIIWKWNLDFAKYMLIHQNNEPQRIAELLFGTIYKVTQLL